MKVSKETAAGNRESLLVAASRLFRKKGFDDVGIAEIAAAAGLTHGAFYTHFESKDALCIEAVDKMMRLRAAELAKSNSKLDDYVDAYLSADHVRNYADGCPFAALGGDAARGNSRIKTAMSRGLEGVFAIVTKAFEQAGVPDARARQRSLASVAALVGGLVLARAAATDELRDEVLAAVKELLKGRLDSF